ncbi:ATP-dependent Clp protease proteolytic subunit [Pycnococcus provasolii]
MSRGPRVVRASKTLSAAHAASCSPRAPLRPQSRSRHLKHTSHPHSRRGDSVVTRVIPMLQGAANDQLPPDLPSYLFKERIIYLGMSLVPSVTELLLAEMLYLQYEDRNKPVFMYINSTGTTKDGRKLGYDTEAMAIYDMMSYISCPIHTLCVGTAWGEAAMLLAAGERGNRASLPSGTIMIKQPINQFRGQASDLDIYRMETRRVKIDTLAILAQHCEKTAEEIVADTSRPLYMSPQKAVEYGLIDNVLEKGRTKDVLVQP